MSHGDRVTKLPDGFTTVAISKNAPFAVVADEARHFYAVQFHPEVAHTPHGALLIRNFVRDIAGCSRRLDHGRLPRGGDRQDPRAGRRGDG